MGCKGICSKLRVSFTVGTSPYDKGYKRCQTCEVYLDWKGIYCPCCRNRLRMKGKYKKPDHKNLTI